MAPVQTKTGSQGAGDTIVITLNAAPVFDNTLILLLGASDAYWIRDINSIVQEGVNWSTDGCGRQVQRYNNDGAGHTLNIEMWLGRVTGGSPSDTITVTLYGHASDFANAIVAEYSGLETSDIVLDKTASFSSGQERSIPPYTGSTDVTTKNNELWLGGFCLFGDVMNNVFSFSIVATESTVTLAERDATYMDSAFASGMPIPYQGFVACIITLKKVGGVPGLTHPIYLYGEHVIFNPAGTEDEGEFFIAVNDMANQTVTFTAAAGYAITGVSIDGGADLGVISEYTFTNVLDYRYIEVTTVATDVETEAFKALRRRFEGVHAGVDFQVTKQTLSLDDDDPDSGWPVVSYTETTEKVIIVPKALQQLLIGLAPMVIHSAIGFAGNSYKQGDRLVNRYGFTWVVEACQAIKKLDKLLYYQLQLRQPFNWESFADPNANQVLNGGFEESSAGQPINWNANMVSVGSGGRTGNCLLMNQEGYVSQDCAIPVNGIGYLQVYMLGGYIDPCFGGARSGTIEVTATFDDEANPVVATYTSTAADYELINLKPLLTGKATKVLTNLQVKNISVRDIQIDDVGIFLAPPVLPYYDMLRRKLEQNGAATSNVTLRVLTLSNSKDDDGWFIKSYTEETISAIILHDSARADAVKLGLMPLYNLEAFTLSQRPKQGDQLQEAGIYYNVDAVTNHIFGDHLVYRELKLTQLPLEGKVAVGNGGD